MATQAEAISRVTDLLMLELGLPEDDGMPLTS